MELFATNRAEYWDTDDGVANPSYRIDWYVKYAIGRKSRRNRKTYIVDLPRYMVTLPNISVFPNETIIREHTHYPNEISQNRAM